MTFDWTTVVNVVATSILSSGLFVGVLRKYPLLLKGVVYVEQHASEIVQEAEAIGKLIVSTPAGAVAAHSLHVEVDRVTEDFKNSEIARLALIGLHSFGSLVENLSDVQKVALVKFVVESVSSDWNINADDVQNILGEAQKAVEAFSQLEIVKAANFFTDAQNSTINKAAGQAQESTPTTAVTTDTSSRVASA